MCQLISQQVKRLEDVEPMGFKDPLLQPTGHLQYSQQLSCYTT